MTVYIHTLREEGDRENVSSLSKTGEISIHALREEGDKRRSDLIPNLVDFYPRPPRGGRRDQPMEEAVMPVFLSTPSARRATRSCRTSQCLLDISIHALREEGDGLCSAHNWHDPKFLSTPSARRATVFPQGSFVWARNFYPRPPRGGRPVRKRRVIYAVCISIHALREESDTVGISA